MRINFHRPGLGTKIILWSFVPTAIILLLVAVTVYVAYQQVTENFVLQSDAELTRLSAGQISSGFEEYIDRLSSLARLPSVYAGDVASRTEALRSAQNQLVFFDGGVYLLNNLGEVVVSQPDQPGWKGMDWSQRPYFQDVLRANEPRFSDVVPDGPRGEPVVVVAVPILGERREFRGMLLGMFRLDSSAVSPFYGTLIKQRIGGTGDAFLIDGNSRVVFASDFNQIGSDFTQHPGADRLLVGKFEAKRSTAPDGRDIVVSYAPVPRSAWRLIIEKDWGALIRKSQGYGQFLLILLALGVLIPTIVVMVGVRAITGPLREFKRLSRSIAGGDFNQSIEIHTKDELEELADQFNAMASQLQDSYANLEKRVADRTKELSAVNSVAEVVSRSLDLNRVLPDALAKTLEVMEMDAGVIFKLGHEPNQLILVAEQGLHPDVHQLALNLPVEYSIIKEVIRTRKPEARRLTDYPLGPVKDTLAGAGVRLVVSIPLLSQEEVLGAINVLSLTDEFPSQEELSAAAAIGQQIGVSMENARLYAQTAAYAREMEKARQVAEEANASKSSFVANVSHELRTPLTSILGFARLVQKRLEERVLPNTDLSDDRMERAASQVQQNLAIIISESQRLTSLINDVLDLEKIEAGRMEWEMHPLRIEEIIELSTANTASLFEGTPLRLEVEIDPGLPQVTGDKDKLLQVMINLLSNAVKFTPAGRVTILARRNAGELVVSVKDTGIGITSEDLPKVFEKFKQVSDGLTGKPKGTGLGLPIVKEIVEHHGGRVWVESTPGIGSTFCFSLPADGAADAPTAREGEAAAVERHWQIDPDVKMLARLALDERRSGPAEPACLLIVSGRVYLRERLRQELEAPDCQVFEAADPENALEYARCLPPDLILFDHQLSESGVPPVAVRIERDPLISNVPSLLLKTYPGEQHEHRVGVKNLLVRPPDLENLIEMVTALLRLCGKICTVLICDRAAYSLAGLSRSVIAQGHRAIQAQERQQVDQAITTHQPDLILLEALALDADQIEDINRHFSGSQAPWILLYQIQTIPEPGGENA